LGEIKFLARLQFSIVSLFPSSSILKKRLFVSLIFDGDFLRIPLLGLELNLSFEIFEKLAGKLILDFSKSIINKIYFV